MESCSPKAWRYVCQAYNLLLKGCAAVQTITMQQTKLLRTCSRIYNYYYYCTLCQHPATGSPSGPCKIEVTDLISVDSDLSVRPKNLKLSLHNNERFSSTINYHAKPIYCICTKIKYAGNVIRVSHTTQNWVHPRVRKKKIYTFFFL